MQSSPRPSSAAERTPEPARGHGGHQAPGGQEPQGTMRAAVLTEPGVIELRDVPAPVPGAGQVLVGVASVGICGSDAHYYHHGRIGDFVVRAPLILGHEASGTIAACGPGVDPARRGQRVALEPGVPCRHCAPCRAGRYNLCPEVRFFATPPVDGTFSDYVVIDADFAHPVPDALSDDAAALIEPVSVAVWACRRARVAPGSSVLISGAGPIGLLMAQVASAHGATRIIVSDVAPARLEQALRFGATEAINAVEDQAALRALDGTIDAYLDASGAAAAIGDGLRALRPAGHAVLVGMGADEITVPMTLLQNRELNVTGSFRYANTYPAAITLAASGRLRLDELVTAHFGLDDVERALVASSDPDMLKVVVRVGASGQRTDPRGGDAV